MKGKLNFLQVLGLVLILASLTLLLGSIGYARNASQECSRTVQQLEAILPPRTAGIPGSFSDPVMPVLQLEGTDYCAIVDFPGYGVTLPVRDVWANGSLGRGPRRYWGSAYDGTLVLGGSDQNGQFDFFDRMDIGNQLLITDMLGEEFSFRVVRIDRAKSVDPDKLIREEYDLTLFASQSYSMEYILIRCEAAQ